MGPPSTVRALDTNVILRLLLEDEPGQLAAARRLVAEPALVGTGVLMETAWVLGSTYRQSRAAIADALTALLSAPTIHASDDGGVRWALARYRDHGADLADMLHIVAARGSSSFASFEKHLAKQAGIDTPVAVEQPT